MAVPALGAVQLRHVPLQQTQHSVQHLTPALAVPTRSPWACKTFNPRSGPVDLILLQDCASCLMLTLAPALGGCCSEVSCLHTVGPLAKQDTPTWLGCV